MGITLSKLQKLREIGALSDKGSVLDIGSSNLYSADVASLQRFAGDFGAELDHHSAERLAHGSAYGPNGGLNESFVGELLEKVGLIYLAFDIANGYRTRIFDLNREAIPENLRGSFDAVLNFGTTEHVINQLNSFRVIHDATKVGGYIVHELPTVGYVDHGYFCYTPRLFFDLAVQNEYEIVSFAYQASSQGNDINSIVRDYRAFFPSLAQAKLIDLTPPTVSSLIVLRKTKEAPFRLSLETGTSVVTQNETVGRESEQLDLTPAAITTVPFGMLTRYWLARAGRGITRRAVKRS